MKRLLISMLLAPACSYAAVADEDFYRGEVLPEFRVARGYSVEVVVQSKVGERLADFDFNADGKLVYTVGAATRVGCDSYFGDATPGSDGIYAEPCIDHPFHVAFNPLEPGAFFTEGEGYWNDMFRVHEGGLAGDAQRLNTGFLVMDADLVFDSQGALYASDQYSGAVYTGSPNTLSALATGFGRSQMGRYKRGHLDLFIDWNDTLYAVDRYAGQVVSIAPDGTKNLVTDAFSTPTAVAVAHDGTMFVGDVNGLYALSDGNIEPIAVGDIFYELVFGPDGTLHGKTTHRIVRIGGATITGKLGNQCSTPSKESATEEVLSIIAALQVDPAYLAIKNGALKQRVNGVKDLLAIGTNDVEILKAVFKLREVLDGVDGGGSATDQLEGEAAITLMQALDKISFAIRTR